MVRLNNIKVAVSLDTPSFTLSPPTHSWFKAQCWHSFWGLSPWQNSRSSIFYLFILLFCLQVLLLHFFYPPCKSNQDISHDLCLFSLAKQTQAPIYKSQVSVLFPSEKLQLHVFVGFWDNCVLEIQTATHM